MPSGYLSLVLHCHLPFVRHPEYEFFLEENWLFEAISETYLPLLRVFKRLEDDRIPFRLTLSLSPTLSAMLGDELLQERYVRHPENLLRLSESELLRTKGDSAFHPLAEMYNDLYRRNLDDFTGSYGGNILKGFDYFSKKGRLELITTAATHAFLPLYEQYPAAIRAQLNTSIESHQNLFGRRSRGFWIPEFGYFNGLEKYLEKYDVDYFFTAAHGVLFADNKPKYGVYAPILCENGIAAFGRDLASANAVWSSDEGYPGDFSYREFYRDIGFDLPEEYLAPFSHYSGNRVNTGLKYYAITGKTDNKRPYQPEVATRKAEEHAENFLYNRQKQIDKLSRIMDRPPMITSPFDAELFGHWWFEGPQWLEFLLRKLNQSLVDIELITPSDYLKVFSDNQYATPSFSSWGNKGYAEVWLDGSNDWVYRHTHKLIERMRELVQRYPNEQGLKQRALNQAAREVLLSQASDWPFIMKTGTTVQYAEKQVREHIFNFNKIYEALCRNTVSTEWLTKLEKKNCLFPKLDYRIFDRWESQSD